MVAYNISDMGQALYRKYRSKSLDEIVGQEHVTVTLANALRNGRISHAYLLSGPRGVGKTSIARILAHEINELPYDDAAHLDIIEIDAASNRRIDEIRDLRDRVNTAPASAKYKVYIIDEVHMLTKEAFNALLKTLEEPPAHVVFILATTEAHKLPETIISRTQRYSLHPVPENLVVSHLREIAKSEKLKIDDEALVLIARHGDGSFRDSISLLDQASSINENITRGDVERVLGLASDEQIAKLAASTAGANKGAVVATLSDLYAQGFEPATIAQQLSAHIRGNILADTSINSSSDLLLLRSLLDVPAARSPRQLLEIVLLHTATSIQAANTVTPTGATVATYTETRREKQPMPAPPRAEVQSPQKTVTSIKKVAVAPAKEDAGAPESTIEQTEAEPEPINPESLEDITEIWQQTLEAIKKQYNTLYGIVRMASPTFDGQRLTLSFKFAFHQKRINEVANKMIIANTVEKLYGKPVQIICITVQKNQESSSPTDLAAINNIFGSTEPLNS